jgi:hypothetical protein
MAARRVGYPVVNIGGNDFGHWSKVNRFPSKATS